RRRCPDVCPVLRLDRARSSRRIRHRRVGVGRAVDEGHPEGVGMVIDGAAHVSARVLEAACLSSEAIAALTNGDVCALRIPDFSAPDVVSRLRDFLERADLEEYVYTSGAGASLQRTFLG